MDNFDRKDGFCRAPRVELIDSNNSFEDLSFDELMNKMSFGTDNSSNMNIVRNLAETLE